MGEKIVKKIRGMSWTTKISLMLIFTLIFYTIGINAWAKEVPFTLEDRDRLIRIEVKIEEMEKRFEQIDKRFEQIDKRFEQVDKRFGDMMSFMWILASVFGGMVAVTISFAIWDRRTMIRPFETRLKEIEEGKIDKLVNSLRELARTDTKVEEVLRKFNLL